MKFGISTFITDEGTPPADLAVALETRGFDALLVAEHTHIPTSRETPYPGGGDLPRKYYRTLDPFVSLTAAAAATQHLLVGTGIALIPERDPITTAKEVASLDLVSGGRFLFGVGAGWNREEMRNHGTDPARRGRLMDERIRAMLGMWHDEQAEFHGELVDFDPIYVWPKPIQQPHPPIYVGGESERALSRLAEYGSGWLPRTSDPDTLRTQIDSAKQQAGWDLPVSLYGASTDPSLIERYAEIGVQRLLFGLPTMAADETLRFLDELVPILNEFSAE